LLRIFFMDKYGLWWKCNPNPKYWKIWI